MRRSQFGSRDIQRLGLLGMFLVALPLAVYPNTFGLQFPGGAGMVYLVELAYYSFTLRLIRSAQNVPEAIVGAGLTLAFRHVVGCLFGLIIYTVGRSGLVDAIQDGLFWYYPAIIIHILAAPFVAAPAARALVMKLAGVAEENSFEKATSRAQHLPSSPIHSRSADQRASGNPLLSEYAGNAAGGPHSASAILSSMGRQAAGEPSQGNDIPLAIAPRRANTGGQKHTDIFHPSLRRERTDRSPQNGFERAIAYLGEVAAVRVASVVDQEGLEVASFSRGGFTSSGWSPRALSVVNGVTSVFPRPDRLAPERVEVIFGDLRVISCKVCHFYLMVVSERHEDELLSVRVAQACEMIGRFVAARYEDTVLREKTHSTVEA